MKTFEDYGLPVVPPYEFFTRRINTTTFIYWKPTGFYIEVLEAMTNFNRARDKKMGYKGNEYSELFRSTSGYKDKKTAMKMPGYLVTRIHDCAKRYIEGQYNISKLDEDEDTKKD